MLPFTRFRKNPGRLRGDDDGVETSPPGLGRFPRRKQKGVA